MASIIYCGLVRDWKKNNERKEEDEEEEVS
jgi:hypothetical protein